MRRSSPDLRARFPLAACLRLGLRQDGGGAVRGAAFAMVR